MSFIFLLNSKTGATAVSVYSVRLFSYLRENIKVLQFGVLWPPWLHLRIFVDRAFNCWSCLCTGIVYTMLLPIFAKPLMIYLCHYSATNRRFSTGDCVIWRIISHTVSTATFVGRCSRNINCSSPSYSPLKFWSEWFLQVEWFESRFFCSQNCNMLVFYAVFCVAGPIMHFITFVPGAGTCNS